MFIPVPLLLKSQKYSTILLRRYHIGLKSKSCSWYVLQWIYILNKLSKYRLHWNAIQQKNKPTTSWSLQKSSTTPPLSCWGPLIYYLAYCLRSEVKSGPLPNMVCTTGIDWNRCSQYILYVGPVPEQNYSGCIWDYRGAAVLDMNILDIVYFYTTSCKITALPHCTGEYLFRYLGRLGLLAPAIVCSRCSFAGV